METTTIGTISACIGHDRSYTTTLIVDLREDGKVEVTCYETVPGGGMDMRAGVQRRRTVNQVVEGTPKAVLTAIKQVLNSQDGSTIRIYGKPTRNFNWYSAGKGLSLAVVKRALSGE